MAGADFLPNLLRKSVGRSRAMGLHGRTRQLRMKDWQILRGSPWFGQLIHPLLNNIATRQRQPNDLEEGDEIAKLGGKTGHSRKLVGR